MRQTGWTHPHAIVKLEITTYEIDRIIECMAELNGNRALLQDERDVLLGLTNIRATLKKEGAVT